MAPPSRSAVRKAGSNVRAHARGELSEEKFEHALQVISSYREQFSNPLVIVNNGLRSFCISLGLPPEVTQRLKKIPTIIDKLSREPGLDLSRMQDIGGCRVVVQHLDDLRRLEARVRATWGERIIREADYIVSPRESGYRALHIIVRWNDRPIEIQLRTRVMHDWAVTVESFSSSEQNYKQDGHHPVQEFLKVFSAVLALEEEGKVPPGELLDKGDRLSRQVSDYLNRD